MTNAFRTLLRLTFAAMLASCAVLAHAWPDRPIRLLVPAPPGGSFDVLGRLFAEHLSKEVKQPVIVENRPGASGIIACQATISAAPDGQTLLFTGSNVLTESPHVIKTPYDTFKDLRPLATLARLRFLLVAPADFPATDMASFARYVKANAGKLSFASSGLGTISHYTGEILNQRLGVQLAHIPFAGAPPADMALMSGQVSFFLDNVVSATPFLKSGKFKAFGIAGSTRFAALPAVPTFEEQGYPEFKDYANWMVVVSSAKVPAATQERIHAVAQKIASSPEFQARVAELGFERVDAASSDQVSRLLLADYDRIGSLARSLNLSPQ